MKNHHPPKLAEWLLEFFLKSELAEEVLGDLKEKFSRKLKDKSLYRARLNYWYQVLNYARPFALKRSIFQLILFPMFKHNFLISYRVLIKNKLFSIINIAGLSLGLSLFILISLWVLNELSFNKYHENYDRTVQVLRSDRYEGKISVNSSLVSKLGIHLKETYPTIFSHIAITFYRNEKQFLKVKKRTIERMGYYFSQDVAEVLSLEILAGKTFSPEVVDEILLSQTLAKTLFPDDNPIGEIVRLNDAHDLIISGIYKDLPQNSTWSEMEYMVPLDLVYNEENPPTWSNQNTKVYGIMNRGVELEAANEIIRKALSENTSNENRITDLLLHPMKDWYLNSNFEDGVLATSPRLQAVRLFSIIGAFVLLVAFINFINLTTAKSGNRIKEIGVRKSMGSQRLSLVKQFLAESFLYAFTAFLLSLIIVALSLNAFNTLSGKDISVPWSQPFFWIAGVGFTLLVALVAGSYPAFFLSSFNPIQALAGSVRQGSANKRLREILVIFQFTISIALIIGTITVYNQLAFAQKRPVGYNQSHLISMRGRSEEWGKKYDILREELKQSGSIIEMASANYPLTNDLGNNDGFADPESNKEYQITFNTIWVNPEYGKTTGWQLLEGRDFTRDLEDERTNIIVSASAVTQMGLEDPIGKVIKAPYNVFGRGFNFKIIGVVEDMIKRSPFEEIKPLMVFCTTYPMEHVFIRLNPSLPYQSSLVSVEEKIASLLSGYPFNYEFLDDSYQQKFRKEEQIGSLSMIFSAFAIIISSMGLFGLSAFLIEQRTKEIGIRKVLGSSREQLWSLLSKDISVLVLMACIVAMPIANYTLEKWLESYPYRTQIDWPVYVFTGVLALLLALGVVSFHIVRATRLNPVYALRSE
ncbi:MAG: FtsX-like permease family protein [Bacteroidota bacterium]